MNGIWMDCALDEIHGPSGRLMRILRPVVSPSTTLMAVRDPEILGSGPIGPQVICDELVWDEAISSKACASISARHACSSCSGPAHRALRPRRRRHAKDRPCGHRFSDRLRLDAKSCGAWVGVCAGPPRSSVRNGSPSAEQFPSDHDAAFRQQLFDVAKAQRQPEIEPDRLLDDLAWTGSLCS